MEEPRDRLQREARMRCPPHPCKVAHCPPHPCKAINLLSNMHFSISLQMALIPKRMHCPPQPSSSQKIGNKKSSSQHWNLNIQKAGLRECVRQFVFFNQSAFKPLSVHKARGPDGIRTRRALGSSLNRRQDCHHK